MSLNIKNQETHTAAVTQAVRERLQRVRKRKHGTLAQRLVGIGKDCAKHLPRHVRSLDHGKLLYNESGLPK